MSTVVSTPRVERSAVERVVREVVARRLQVARPGRDEYKPNLVANISARHMHITQEQLELLFGAGSHLTVMRPLYQEGEFASEQAVTIIGPRHRMIPNLRILGPVRPRTQVELAFTDGIALGIELPVRLSGDLDGTPGCIVLGPKGHLVLESGVIRAERHVHMNERDAEYYGVRQGDRMKLRVQSSCPITLEGILCRVNPKFKLEVHVDTDEGNACDLANATHVGLLKE